MTLEGHSSGIENGSQSIIKQTLSASDTRVTLEWNCVTSQKCLELYCLRPFPMSLQRHSSVTSQKCLNLYCLRAILNVTRVSLAKSVWIYIVWEPFPDATPVSTYWLNCLLSRQSQAPEPTERTPTRGPRFWNLAPAFRTWSQVLEPGPKFQNLESGSGTWIPGSGTWLDPEDSVGVRPLCTADFHRILEDSIGIPDKSLRI